MDLNYVDIQSVEAEWLSAKKIKLDVLRLDTIHPVVSGNKYFKLKYYLQEAKAQNKTTVATFGGAWSNHIVATAYACNEAGLASIGFIRGEKSSVLSDTLKAAIEYGMELRFVSREEYRYKEEIRKRLEANWYWIDEGGYGTKGAIGASEIINLVEPNYYTHIIAAVGTGTMLAGLLLGANEHQRVIGISSMKGNGGLEQQVLSLLSPQTPEARFEINHSYHFGGYGKHPADLIKYISKVYETHKLPLDIVYTGKTFFAIQDLAQEDFFPEGSSLLMIHSGGLQGNRSLPAKVLPF